VSVGNYPCTSLTAASANTVDCVLPEIQTTHSVANYKRKAARIVPKTWIGSSIHHATAAQDGSLNTASYFVGANCNLGIDLGAGSKGLVNGVNYALRQMNNLESGRYNLVKIEGSNDNSAWTELATLGQQGKVGWNSKAISTTTAYRYLRWNSPDKDGCRVSEIQYRGFTVNDSPTSSAAPVTVDVELQANGKTEVLAGKVTYSPSLTPVVTSISPSFGVAAGGTVVTVTGTNLANVNGVDFSGVACSSIASQTATSF